MGIEKKGDSYLEFWDRRAGKHCIVKKRNGETISGILRDVHAVYMNVVIQPDNEDKTIRIVIRGDNIDEVKFAE